MRSVVSLVEVQSDYYQLDPSEPSLKALIHIAHTYRELSAVHADLVYFIMIIHIALENVKTFSYII